MRSADIASPAAAFRSGRQSPSSAERLADVRESHFVLADNRPVVIAGGAAPFQHCDNAFHRRFQFHLRVRATMRTLFRDAEGHHAIKDSWSAAAFWLVRFMVPATFHIDRFAFAMERGRNTFAQVSRFSQQVIDVAAATGIIIGRSVTWHGRNFYASPELVPNGVAITFATK